MAKTKEERAKEQAEKVRESFTASQSERVGLSGSQAAPVVVSAKVPLSPVKQIDPELLTPNQRNTFDALPRKEFIRLRDDIKARGVLVPLVVMPANRNPEDGSAENYGGTILAGHNRYRVAKILKRAHILEKIPVQYVNRPLSDADERRFIVADNLLRRQLTPEDKARLLAELYPGYFDDDGQAGRKKELVHGAPITQKDVAKATGASVDTIKRAKVIHKKAKDKAAARGDAKPTTDDYRAAAEDKNKERRGKPKTTTPPGKQATHTEQDFDEMPKADRENRGKGPVRATGKIPRLADVLKEAKRKYPDAGDAIKWIRAELKAAGLV